VKIVKEELLHCSLQDPENLMRLESMGKNFIAQNTLESQHVMVLVGGEHCCNCGTLVLNSCVRTKDILNVEICSLSNMGID